MSKLSFTDLGSLIGITQSVKNQDLSAIQILLEIDFGRFDAPNTAIFSVLAAFEWFLGTIDIFTCKIFQKIKIQSLQNC